MRQVAAGLAELDQGLQARAALGHVFFRQHGLVETEFLHQRAFFGLADFHAQRLDLFPAGDFRFADQIGFDVGHVQVIAGLCTCRCLGLAAAFSAGFCGRFIGSSGRCLGRASGPLFGLHFSFRNHGFGSSGFGGLFLRFGFGFSGGSRRCGLGGLLDGHAGTSGHQKWDGRTACAPRKKDSE